MHQRWHYDDLAGRLLQRMVTEDSDGDGRLADQWTVLNLPAIAEPWSQAVDPDAAIGGEERLVEGR